MTIETIYKTQLGVDQRAVFLNKEKPLIDIAQDHYTLVMSRAGIAAYEEVQRVYAERSSISPEDQRALKKIIDNTSARFGIDGFTMISWGDREANFYTQLPVVEGDKEGRKNKEDAVWVPRGSYSPKITFLDKPTIRVSGAADFVEGTGFLSRRESRAISIFAGIIDGHIEPVRSEDDAQYREMLVASHRMQGKIDIEEPIENTIDVLLDAYNLSNNPSGLTMKILGGPKRVRNHEIIERARQKGIKVDELTDGDAAPIAEIILSDKPIFYAGSGGKDESTITAVIAYARNAHWQGRDISIDPDDGHVTHKYSEIWVPGDIVRGNPDKAFFIAVGITGEPHLNLSPIEARYSPDGKTASWIVDTLKASGSKTEIETFTYSSV